jgi:hypothetical protein
MRFLKFVFLIYTFCLIMPMTSCISNKCSKFIANATIPVQEHPIPWQEKGGLVGSNPLTLSGIGAYYVFSWSPVTNADFYTLQIFYKNGLFKEFSNLKSSCFCYERDVANNDYSKFFGFPIEDKDRTEVLEWRVIAFKAAKTSDGQDCSTASARTKFYFQTCDPISFTEFAGLDKAFKVVYDRKQCDCFKP